MESGNHMGNLQKNNSKRSNTWTFPETIDFETASHYIFTMGNINYNDVITFDLRKTLKVHSSFIGFLIDLKQRVEGREGVLVLLLSPALEKLFLDVNLYTHFIPKEMAKAI